MSEPQPSNLTAPAAATPVTPPDLSVQFLELQKKEKELRAQKVKAKSEIEAEKQKIVEKVRANPLEGLKELGIAPEVLANQFLTAPKPLTGAALAEKRLAELEAKLAEKEARERAEDEARTLQAYDKEIFSVVESDSDAFELINNHRDGKKLFKDAVYAYWKEYGEAPDPKAIAAEVEAELETEAKRMLKLKKLSTKPDPAPSAATQSETDSSAPKKMKPTLTSEYTATSTPKIKVVLDAGKVSAQSAAARLELDRMERLKAAYAKHIVK